MAKLRKDRWNTYEERCFTRLYGDNERAAGGIEIRQVRQARNGRWLHRCGCVNCFNVSYGNSSKIPAAEGLAFFETAQKDEDRCAEIQNRWPTKADLEAKAPAIIAEIQRVLTVDDPFAAHDSSCYETYTGNGYRQLVFTHNFISIAALSFISTSVYLAFAEKINAYNKAAKEAATKS